MKKNGKGRSGKGGNYFNGEHGHEGRDVNRSQIDDYEVGYGRPPPNKRFVKGVSGNPKGRPKGSTNFNVLFDKLLRRKVLVRENGLERKVEVAEVMATSIMNKAMKGDLRASRFVLERQEAAHPQEEIASATMFAPIDSDDLAVIEAYIASRNREAKSLSVDAGPEPGAISVSGAPVHTAGVDTE